jgi:hypothetical protein
MRRLPPELMAEARRSEPPPPEPIPAVLDSAEVRTSDGDIPVDTSDEAEPEPRARDSFAKDAEAVRRVAKPSDFLRPGKAKRESGSSVGRLFMFLLVLAGASVAAWVYVRPRFLRPRVVATASATAAPAATASEDAPEASVEVPPAPSDPGPTSSAAKSAAPSASPSAKPSASARPFPFPPPTAQPRPRPVPTEEPY